MHSQISVIKNSQLKPHEHIQKRYLKKLLAQIKRDGFIDNPIIVDKNTMVILDGHHRFNVLRLLGFQSSPVYFCRL